MPKSALAVQLVSSTDSLPAHLKVVEGAGRGNENVGQNVQIPRIKLLQKMSNEVDKHHASYVEGCEPGHLVNTLTNHNYGNDLYVLSLHFKTEFVVWRRSPAIMDFASSKLRVSKAWNSQIGMKGGDRFAGLWKVSGVPTENKMGKAFMNCEVSFVGWAQEEDYKTAEALYEQYAK